MKKKLLVALILCSSSVFAQKSAVLQAFKKYNVSEDVLNTNFKANLEKYAHEVQRTVTLNEKDKVYISNFNPNEPDSLKCTLVSVNGKSPSKGEQKAFVKEHDMKLDFKIDENTLKITKDDGTMLEVSYQYDPASLDKDHQFLKDCLYTLHIDAKTARLEKLTEINVKDLKIKILKVTKMATVINFKYIEKDKIYVPTDSAIEIIIRMLGNELPMLTSEKYTIK
ncbi:hypothetical protein [Pedobacter xixiisoli]|uniref:Outer membrane lipoprotein-sorting protein n=1 Tax=Pedobacter xixiisoli TaxID=1476464 RepID=A0A285ZUQ1_9SPHI|nr:hypothetical protein [Pedobacter xixiisoli]SOD13381.1 hypothetical protein SAMN06297358_1209 [Pedobacter xixiisoli]